MPAREPVIRCPACGYRPTAEDRWSCMPSCGTVFHTFWTGGVCPTCAWAWEKTQCPRCGVLSPHKAWYRWPEGAEGESDTTRERDRSAEPAA
jgi:hypothetical protein